MQHLDRVMHDKQIYRDYDFAVRFGFKGDLREYINKRYKRYANICARCKINPMTQQDWEASYNWVVK